MDSTHVSTQALAQPETASALPESKPSASPMDQPTHIQASAVQAGDRCPSCGAVLAADQRYCLECGQRRGDPRLPFMDAVVLMNAVKRPQAPPPSPPKKKRSGISPNAALIAGVGTLLLALGIGVLIGRSGHQEVAQTAATPQVITVGGGEAPKTKSNAKTAVGGGAGSGSDKASKKSQTALKKEAESGAAAEEVLKPAAGVKLPPPTAQPGEACENGTAGCEHGKQTGNYFGP
jgi:hypothetical protein